MYEISSARTPLNLLQISSNLLQILIWGIFWDLYEIHVVSNLPRNLQISQFATYWLICYRLGICYRIGDFLSICYIFRDFFWNLLNSWYACNSWNTKLLGWCCERVPKGNPKRSQTIISYWFLDRNTKGIPLRSGDRHPNLTHLLQILYICYRFCYLPNLPYLLHNL